MQKAVTVGVLVLLATIGLSAYAYTVYFNGSTSSIGGPGSGTLNIYLADPPPHNATLKYLLINVTSITLKYSSNVTETTSATSSSSSSSTSSSSSGTASTTTGFSTSSGSTGTSSAASSASQSTFENRFVFNVSSSLGRNVNLTKLQGSAILLGSPKVPAGNVVGIIMHITGAEAFWTNGSHTQLKVVANGKLMIPVHFTVQSTGTTNLNLNLVPGDIHVSPGNQSVLRPVVHVTVVSSGPSGTETTSTTVTESESSSSSSTGST